MSRGLAAKGFGLLTIDLLAVMTNMLGVAQALRCVGRRQLPIRLAAFAGRR